PDGTFYHDKPSARTCADHGGVRQWLPRHEQPLIRFGWRQEKVAENVQRVHELGRELYRRTLAMTEHIQNCGAALGKSVTCFNEFIGSLEHSVMPQARRFNELEVEGTATDIPLLGHIEVEPRLLRADRDFAEQLAV